MNTPVIIGAILGVVVIILSIFSLYVYLKNRKIQGIVMNRELIKQINLAVPEGLNWKFMGISSSTGWKDIQSSPRYTKLSKYVYYCIDNGVLMIVIYNNHLNFCRACGLFRGVSAKELSISYIDSRWIEDLSYMFADCKQLRRVSIIGLDMSNVKDISNMFSGDTNLVLVEVYDPHVIHIENKRDMYEGCISLKATDFFPDEVVTELVPLDKAKYIWDTDEADLEFIKGKEVVDK